MSAARKKTSSHRAPRGGRAVVLGVAMMFTSQSLRECTGSRPVIDETSIAAPATAPVPAVPVTTVDTAVPAVR